MKLIQLNEQIELLNYISIKMNFANILCCQRPNRRNENKKHVNALNNPVRDEINPEVKLKFQRELKELK